MFNQILNIGDAITWYGESMDLQSSSNAMVFAQDSRMYTDLPKSILCMPIYNGQRQVIGVAQLINKVRFNLSRAVNLDVLINFTHLCRVIINISLIRMSIHLRHSPYFAGLEFTIHNYTKELVSNLKLLTAGVTFGSIAYIHGF